MNVSPFLYALGDPAAEHARQRDHDFFVRHPRQTWRVPPAFEGESPLADGMRELGWRTYCIVIDHARAGDKRAKAGRGVYPLVIRGDDKLGARWRLSQEAVRWTKWFRKHSTTPPPKRGTGVVIRGGQDEPEPPDPLRLGPGGARVCRARLARIPGAPGQEEELQVGRALGRPRVGRHDRLG